MCWYKNDVGLAEHFQSFMMIVHNNKKGGKRFYYIQIGFFMNIIDYILDYNIIFD